MPSLKETLKKRREQLDQRKGGNFNFFVIQEGKVRMRALPVPENSDWAKEVVYFYLGQDIKGYISPATFDEPCAIMKLYNKLSKSDDDDDKAFAKNMKPQKRWLVPHIRYKDDAGQEIDTQAGAKLLLLSDGLYKDILDLYLDPDNGDFTNPLTGYDLKYARVGKTKTDTKYTVLPGKPSKLPKEFRKEYDIDKMVREIIPSYEESKAIRDRFLNVSPSESEEEAPKKKKKKSSDAE